MSKKHEWLKTALSIAGHTQKDLATAWAKDPAIVSRFIKTGVPKPDFDEVLILSRMIGIDVQELGLRLGENLAPKQAKALAAIDAGSVPGSSADHLRNAITDLHGAAARVRKLMPAGGTVRVTIDIGQGRPPEE